MSCMINPLLMKPTTISTTTNASLIFFPTSKPLFSNLSSSLSILSKTLKPLQLSFTLSAQNKKTHLPSLIPFAVDDSTAVLEEIGEFGWDNQDSDGTDEAELSDWEGEVPEEDAVGDYGEGAGDEEVQDSDRPEDRKIFVGNLSYDIDDQKLGELFGQAGYVDDVNVVYNNQTGQSRGFGFVMMRSVEEAEKAVEMLSGYDLSGRLLTVNKAGERATRPERQPRVFDSSSRVYVGNLPWQVDDARLQQIFSKYGKVLNARVVSDRESGRSRGFGFVTMSTESELNDAVSNLDGQDLDGRSIRVNVAEERRPRSF